MSPEPATGVNVGEVSNYVHTLVDDQSRLAYSEVLDNEKA